MSLPRLLATTMIAHLPLLPVLLFVFLAAHVPASHGDPAPPLLTTYDSSMCPEQLVCGGVSIQYPFYLSNTIRYNAGNNYNASYSCGYTDLEITCKDEGPNRTPVISLGGHDYTVLNISYNDSHTIILAEADSDVLSAGSCPEAGVLHNVTLDEAWVWPRNTSSNDNLTFYFGCSFSGGPGAAVQPYLKKYEIDCSGEVASFVFTPHDGHDKAQEHELDQDGHCNEVVSVPVRSDVLMARDQSMLAKGGSYAEVLKNGFELEWYPETTDRCHSCELSGGKCAYYQDRQFQGCLCAKGKVEHQDPFCTPSKSMSPQGASR